LAASEQLPLVGLHLSESLEEPVQISGTDPRKKDDENTDCLQKDSYVMMVIELSSILIYVLKNYIPVL